MAEYVTLAWVRHNRQAEIPVLRDQCERTGEAAACGPGQAVLGQ